MIKPNSKLIFTTLFAAAIVLVGSVDAQSDASLASKLGAVRDHLGATSNDVEWSAISKACERAASIQGIVVDAGAAELKIALELDRPVPFRIVESNGDISIEMVGAVLLPQARTLRMDSGRLIQAVGAELAAVEPVLVSRASVQVSQPMALTAHFEGSTLVVVGQSHDSFVVPQHSEDFLSAVREEVNYGSSVEATLSKLDAAIATARASVEDAKLGLLESELSSTEDASRSGVASGIASLSHELDMLSQARDQVVQDRQTALRSLDAGAELVAALAALNAFDDASNRRVNALLLSAESQGAAAAQLARSTAVAGESLDALAVMQELEGAFGELRQTAPSATELNGLDSAMAAIAAVEPNVELLSESLAAVKSSDVTKLTPAPAPRASSDSPASFLPASTVSSLGEITVVQNGQEPIRLAQNDDITFTAPSGGTFQLYRRGVPPEQDPLQQPVTIDFRDMDLLNVVSLLAEKGEINVIAGTEVRGTVTASLQDIPLGRAIEIILRMNGLGIVEEAGVYRITTYEEAVESRRETRIIFLQNTRSEDVEQTLRQAVRGPDASSFRVSENEETNTIILSGSAEIVSQMAAIVEKMDSTPQTIPTVTKVFRLNHAVPTELEEIVDDILSDDGEVNSDIRSRQLVVTDTPGKIADIEELVAMLDEPVKQVAIEATIADVVMDDTAQTGIDWVISRLPSGNVQSGSIDVPFAPPSVSGGIAALSVLSGEFDVDLMLFGEVTNNNAEILANPVVVTVENSPARITIAEEFPFREQSETGEGGIVSSTEFKDIGTVLEVTPRITHQNEVVVAIEVQQSSVSGLTPDNIPIEDEREVLTTLRLQDGQTVFIGGLRKFQDSVGQRKMPILGNIPVVGLLFGNRNVVQDHVELLVFLTCNVLNNQLPELTPYQQERYDDVAGREMRPNAERTLVQSYVKPGIYRDPFYKWRRDK